MRKSLRWIILHAALFEGGIKMDKCKLKSWNHPNSLFGDCRGYENASDSKLCYLKTGVDAEIEHYLHLPCKAEILSATIRGEKMPKRDKSAAAKLDDDAGTHPVNTREIEDYKPRTSLGKKLVELRKKIIASGEPLLGWEEIEREVARLRGEHE